MPVKRIAILAVVLIIAIALGLALLNPDSARQVLVDLELAEPEADTYLASGLLEARTHSLGSQSGAVVVELLVAEGTSVERNDLLVSFESTFLELQIELAEARRDAAQAALQSANAGPRKVDLAVTQAAVDQAQAVLDGALQALDDTKAGLDTGLLDEKVAIAEALVDQALAAHAAAVASHQVLSERPSEQELKALEAALDAVSAELQGLEHRLEVLAIHAPVSGIVLQYTLLPGELALPGQPVVLLAEPDPMELTVFIPENMLNWVSLGASATISVDGFPDEQFEGQVSSIADHAEYTPRNVQTPDERVILVYAVKIKIPNADHRLKPGMPAEAVFEVQQ